MFMMKKPLIAAMTIAVALMTGCGEDKTAGTVATGDKDVVAVVNGTNITRQDLDGVKAQMPGRGSDEQIVEQLVELKVLADKAVTDGLDKDPAIVAELARARESILANHLVKKAIEGKTFTDEEMKAEYDQVVAKMPKKEELKAAHILVEDEKLAKDLQAKLSEGADFAQLAKQHSTDPGSKDQGGDLGWFEASMMVPEFASAVSGLEPGKLTAAPVKTQFGWHIIKLEEKRAVPPPAFDSVKPQLTNMMRQKAVEKYVDDARKAAKVEIKLPKAEEAKSEATDKPNTPAAK
ncbi:MAG: foldase protein PrsA [Pseudomonadota bacterium]